MVYFWHKPLASRPSQALQAPLKGRQRVPGAGPGILEISPRLQKKKNQLEKNEEGLAEALLRTRPP